MADTSDISKGSLVRHRYRKTVTYQIVEDRGNKVSMRAVIPSSNGGWQDKGNKYTYRAYKKDLIKVGEHPLIQSLETGRMGGSSSGLPALEREGLESKLSFGVISRNIMDEFTDLASQLSPESLTCDGELTSREVDLRHADLMRKWKLLESYLGYSVSESLVFEYDLSIAKAG
jgi:hypothetical protein